MTGALPVGISRVLFSIFRLRALKQSIYGGLRGSNLLNDLESRSMV